ncbi:MAG: N-acetylmuramoyl-L-alanine amidase [Chlamydiae bacterium]|nr:N-acetylmuramoyl-L-alanine amidase [Chlamydiota bacterium]MBI3265810.1 N-acetylmuramoyl-L-alanine amidase [Chlamydiota bacterium]
MRKILCSILLFFPLLLEAQTLTVSGLKGSVQVPTRTLGSLAFVPASSFAQAYGLQEIWNSKSKTLVLQSPQTKIAFRASSTCVWVNGKILRLPTRAKMVNGRLFIPFESSSKIFSPFHRVPTSPKKETPPTPPSSKPNFVVVIDPGHGGYDIGARDRKGLNEKDINLDVAKRVRDKLSSYGIQATMTRSRDVFVGLPQRVSIAKSARPNLFISIHTNAARNRNVSGTEIFYYAQANIRQNGSSYQQNRLKSYQLAKLVQYHTGKTVRSRGVKDARYFVLKNATYPAILLEMGFITHAWEEKNLNNPKHRDKLAQAIVQSVLDYKARNK